MKTRALAFGIGLLCVVGCTHIQLKKNTIRQAGTLSEVYQQQVLDNLAMFVHDPHAFPHFAIPSQGASDVADRGTLQGVIKWIAAGFDNAQVTATVERRATQGWTLTPISDPHKLALMRCAYQRVLANCGKGMESTYCPDCPKRFEEFYANHGHPGDDHHCLNTACWFCWGHKKDVPKDCCDLVGHYCGTYVWVPRGPGRAVLANLTLTILDFAIYDPPAKATKDVVVYLNAKNRPATSATAVKKISATIAIDQDPDVLIPSHEYSADAIRKKLGTSLFLPRRRSGVTTDIFGIRAFEQRRRTLSPDR